MWWAHEVDDPDLSALMDAGRPYARLDHDLGIFSTRSPLRSNPLALTVIKLASVDVEAGIIETPYFDAQDGTPVLDLKPNTPSIDRVERPQLPAWCAHWPGSVETSGDFDWAGEFRF
ncbi:TrmO family methyltransferase [Gordonibacter sp. 28C]|uniref:TrmO family methyltransferase domain-containing protein n=1 Tax=Gordonibacter sp. 28C TaxID=2078569 RepID=UPI001F540979|nr:TrmO family methyltransferase [Gordonibacter sp. 28C]